MIWSLKEGLQDAPVCVGHDEEICLYGYGAATVIGIVRGASAGKLM